MRLFSFLFAAFILASCQFGGGRRVAGNGHVKSEEKKVGPFDEVEVGGAIKVHLSQGVNNTVRLETDENLLEYIQVDVDGDRLKIHTRNNVQLDPSKEVIAYITAPALQKVDVSGACDIFGDTPITGSEALSLEASGASSIHLEISVPRLDTHLSGSGDATIKGKATEFNAEISGSSQLNCFDLLTERTSLNLSGASDVEVNANKELVIDASGASSVKYKGNPSLRQDISGAGSVKKVD